MKVLISDLNDERQNYEKIKKTYENEKYLSISENRSINGQLQQKQQEVNELTSRINQMEYRMTELTRSQQNTQELENRVALLS